MDYESNDTGEKETDATDSQQDKDVNQRKEYTSMNDDTIEEESMIGSTGDTEGI